MLSVEGATALLRRASLRSMRRMDGGATVESYPASTPSGQPAGHSPVHPLTGGTLRPYRPRARVLSAPAGASTLDRLRALTDAGAANSAGETVVLDPAAAADRIIHALRSWGYIS